MFKLQEKEMTSMSIPNSISAFIYIGILLIGTFTATIYIIKSILEKQSLYKVGAVFTGAFLFYSAFEFLLSYFSKDPNSQGLYHICIAISDICYFFLVVSWLFLLGILSGNAFLIRRKILLIITVIYGALVEILVMLHWGLNQGVLRFGTMSLDVMQLILVMNLAFSLVLIYFGFRCLLFGLTKMHGEKLQKIMVSFSLVFLIYLFWISYWDYSIVSWEESNILKFDPILIVFLLSCLISLGMLYRKDALINFSSASGHNDIDEEELWQRLSKKHQLTQREIEIARLVYLGQSNPDIGRELFIAEDTVKKHLNHIFRKTKTKNRYELLSSITKELKS